MKKITRRGRRYIYQISGVVSYVTSKYETGFRSPCVTGGDWSKLGQNTEGVSKIALMISTPASGARDARATIDPELQLRFECHHPED